MNLLGIIVDWSPLYLVTGYPSGGWSCLTPFAYLRLLKRRLTEKPDPYPERPKNDRLNVQIDFGERPKGMSLD